MPKVIDTIRSASTPLGKFLGQDCKVLQATEIAINNNIKAQRLEVSFDNAEEPEEQGRLFLLPIDEARFSLQLCYLIYGTDAQENTTVYSITFLPAFFDQFPAGLLIANRPFSMQQSAELQFFICAKSMAILNGLGAEHGFTSLANALNAGIAAASLLNRALESIAVPFTVCQVPACRFLAYDSERVKIQEAVTIIEQQIGKPLTIKELARKVAMNECYLKKGFKAITGRTIHEYQQELRIDKARELLQHQGYSVTSAAQELGYSSIAHFSTAFKRVKGLKPCELLG